MSIQFVHRSDFELLVEAEIIWRSAVRSGYLAVTYNYDWIRLWFDHVFTKHLQSGYQLWLIGAYEGQRLIGLFPAMISRRRKAGLLPYRTLLFIGHGMVDSADVIIDPSCSEEKRQIIIDGFVEYLALSSSEWDEAKFYLIPDESPNLAMYRSAVEKHFSPARRLVTSNLFIPTPSGKWERFLSEKGKDIRSDIKRRMNKLGRLGEFYLRTTRDVDLDILFNTMSTMHARRQAMLGRTSMFAQIGQDRFVRGMFELSRNQGTLDVATLDLEGRVIAYMFGFRLGRVRYSWNVGFSPDYEDISPGKILMYLWIREAFDNPDVDEFNFMRGRSDFKLKWTSQERLTWKLHFSSPSFYSKALRHLSELRKN